MISRFSRYSSVGRTASPLSGSNSFRIERSLQADWRNQRDACVWDRESSILGTYMYPESHHS